MPEEVRYRFLAAQRSALVATLAMAVVAALQLFIFVTYLFAETSLAEGVSDALRLIAMLATIASTILLASFFWCFGKDRSPFGLGQSLRLSGAGALFMIRMALDAFVPSQVADSISSLTERPEVNLQLVTIVVFLACLAIVMRYGDALKEDSDSIA